MEEDIDKREIRCRKYTFYLVFGCFVAFAIPLLVFLPPLSRAVTTSTTTPTTAAVTTQTATTPTTAQATTARATTAQATTAQATTPATTPATTTTSFSTSKEMTSTTTATSTQAPTTPTTTMTTIIPTTANAIYDLLACDVDPANLTCPTGKTIKVLKAFYGRSNSTICTKGQSMSNFKYGCFTLGAIDLVSAKCSGLKECSITASYDLFGDPCPNIYKYQEIEYTCI